MDIQLTARDWLERVNTLVDSPEAQNLLGDHTFKIMNVCGGHERSISMAGIRNALQGAQQTECDEAEISLRSKEASNVKRQVYRIRVASFARLPCRPVYGRVSAHSRFSRTGRIAQLCR